MNPKNWLSASLVPLIAVPAAASGTLLDDGVLVLSFADASGITPISGENDGTYIWTAAGGFPNYPLARYSQAGTLDMVFMPGPDFRSIYTDNAGNLFAKEFGLGNVWSITQAGTGTILYTLNDLEVQSAAGLDGNDSELYTMSIGQIRRYDAANGAPLGSFTLIGWGSVGTEANFPDDIQMETNDAGRILTYTQGIVSEWDLAGNRVGMCNLSIATPSGFDTTWSFGVDRDGLVYLYDETNATWQVYDVGAGGGSGPGTPICFGDGTGTACPCLNNGAPGEGCANGTGGGGLLTASGTASVSNDTMSLTANGVINDNGLFFQGNDTIGGGAGSVFGDGLRCCNGSMVHIQVVNPPGTMSPATAQMTETATTNGPAGTITAGATKCYQFWYRDPSTSPCGAMFNLTNAVTITWQP